VELNPKIQATIEQITKLPPPARFGAIAAIALLFVVSYFGLVYRDASQRFDNLRAQELDLERRLSEVRSVAANLQDFEEEIAGLELKLSGVLRQLPDKKELEVLLTDISNLGKQSGIEIKSFKRKEEVDHGFYAEVPIDIELEGEYHDVAHFFDLLGRLPRIVNMGSIKTTVADENLAATRLKIDGTATTYRFVGKAPKA